MQVKKKMRRLQLAYSAFEAGSDRVGGRVGGYGCVVGKISHFAKPGGFSAGC